jgi:hypothetical protein
LGCRSRFALAALASLLIVATADASIIRGLTLKDLRGCAESIVAGTVVGLRTVCTVKNIETVARVRVDVHGLRTRFGAKQPPGQLPSIFGGDFNAANLYWTAGFEFRF